MQKIRLKIKVRLDYLKQYLITLFKFLISADFLKIVLPLLIVILTWYTNEQSKIKWEQYKRKEESYKNLIKSAQGFYSPSEDVNLKKEFVQELSICWLYAPDNVILKGNRFIETTHVKNKDRFTSDERKRILSEFILAIRQDLISGKILDKTNLTAENYEHFRIVE